MRLFDDNLNRGERFGGYVLLRLNNAQRVLHALQLLVDALGVVGKRLQLLRLVLLSFSTKFKRVLRRGFDELVQLRR